MSSLAFAFESPSGKELYLTVHPSPRPNTDTVHPHKDGQGTILASNCPQGMHRMHNCFRYWLNLWYEIL